MCIFRRGLVFENVYAKYVRGDVRLCRWRASAARDECIYIAVPSLYIYKYISMLPVDLETYIQGVSSTAQVGAAVARARVRARAQRNWGKYNRAEHSVHVHVALIRALIVTIPRQKETKIR